MSVVANVAINVDAANAIQQLNRVKTAATDVQGGFNSAAAGAKGLGGALQAALGPLLTITTALTAVKAGLDTAFERGAAEQRLRNITSSAGEFNAAMALAADTSAKFGLTQTESTKALADVYSRLKGVGFGLQETGQIYQGFNAIAKQSGLAGEEAAGAFFQLSQALGKGKLNGDEFVIIAERMPQLLDAIAQTTGKSRGELQGMAQDGKITSQVLYEALSGAAAASENLNGKLTAQQQTFNNLRQVTDQLLNSIGQVFAPVVIAGAQGLATVGQMLADWWGYIGNVIFPKVYEALQPVITSLKAAFEDINFDAIRVAIQSILIKGFETAVGVISNFSKVLAAVIDGFKALSQNPVFQFIAEQVGRLANFLGLTNDKVGEFKQKQDEATQAAADTVKQYSSLPPQIEDAKEKAKLLKEEQRKIKEEQQAVTAAARENAQVQESLLRSQAEYAKAKGDTVLAAKIESALSLETYQNKLKMIDIDQRHGKITSENAVLMRQTAELEKASTDEKIKQEVAQNNIKNTASETLTVYQDIHAVNKQTLSDLQAMASADQLRLQTAKARGDSTGTILNLERQIMENKKMQALTEATINGYTKENRSLASQIAKYTMDAKIEAAEYAYNMARAAGSMREIVGMASAKAVGVQYDFGPAGQNEAFMAAYRNAMEAFREDQAKSFVSVSMTEKNTPN